MARLKATDEALRSKKPLASNSTRPLPVKLQDMPQQKQVKPTDQVADFQFTTEKKLQQTSEALRIKKRGVEADRDFYLANYKSQLKAQREAERQVPLRSSSTQWAAPLNKRPISSSFAS